MAKVLTIGNAESLPKSFQVLEEMRKKVAILVDFHQVGEKSDACFVIDVAGNVVKQYHEAYWVRHVPNVTDINNKRFIVMSLEYSGEKIASQEQISSLATIIISLSKVYATITHNIVEGVEYAENYLEFCGIVMASNVIQDSVPSEETLVGIKDFFADRKAFASAYLTVINTNYLAEEVVPLTTEQENIIDGAIQEEKEGLQEVVKKKKGR